MFQLKILRASSSFQDKPTTWDQEWKCFKLVIANQVLIQTPFFSGAYFFCQYMNIPFDYESMPVW